MKKSDKNWPPKWVDVYPHGTKEGNEEFEFFKIIARDPKWDFRSVSSIAKDTGLSKERVEEIIQKYYKKGMLFQKPGNEDFWGYWERVPDMVPKKVKSIGATDKEQRIKKSKDLKDIFCDKSENLINMAASQYENFIFNRLSFEEHHMEEILKFDISICSNNEFYWDKSFEIRTSDILNT